MTIVVDKHLPEQVTQLLRDIEGALGDQLVGVIMFGSWSNGKADQDSDLDLAVIVADAAAEQNRQVVLRVLGASRVDQSTLSLSIESYMRIKEFLKLGDPFAWVVCAEGTILKDRSELLSELQLTCKAAHIRLESVTVSRYLRSKSRNHHELAMQAFQRFLSSIQLSVMAGAQAVATDRFGRTVGPDDLVALAAWENLKQALVKASANPPEIEKVEWLINAHKQVRKDNADFVGRELMDMVRDVGELWKKLLPRHGNSNE